MFVFNGEDHVSVQEHIIETAKALELTCQLSCVYLPCPSAFAWAAEEQCKAAEEQCKAAQEQLVVERKEQCEQRKELEEQLKAANDKYNLLAKKEMPND